MAVGMEREEVKEIDSGVHSRKALHEGGSSRCLRAFPFCKCWDTLVLGNIWTKALPNRLEGLEILKHSEVISTCSKIYR